MPTISSNTLQVEINLKGAELASVQRKDDQTEYIWQADPQIWGRHAPILFPIVGRLRNNQYSYKGNTYQMGQHGFARDREFELKAEENNRLLFVLKADEQSKAMYPFDFSLAVSYELKGSLLKVLWQIQNLGSEVMPFSIGAHPGFRIPLEEGAEYEDYHIEFDKKENLNRFLLTDGLFNGEERRVLKNEHRLELTRGMFEEDALVFNHPKSSRLTLKSDRHKHGLSLSMRAFPYLGIWAKPGADFVCLEPWQGIADHVHASGDIFEKGGIMLLGPGEEHFCSYDLSFF
jgi:galactose mutarotase-like enzyme